MAEPRETPEARAQRVGMAALIVLGCAILYGRARRPGEPEGARVIVEVRGEVPEPGFYALPAPATLADAVRAAGGSAAGLPERALALADRVELGPAGARVGRSDEALTLGAPLDLNGASVAGLETLPGIGARKAADIVADREANGPFASVDELDRVRGFGPATVERLRPWLVVGAQD